MTDLLFQVGLSNFLFSAALAVVAYAVHRRGRYPALAHTLWVLVLATAVTPPLLTMAIPLGPVAEVTAGVSGQSTAGAMTSPGVDVASSRLVAHGTAVLVTGWFLGSALVLVVSTRRIRRFGRLLHRSTTVAPYPVQRLAESLAETLGLRQAPVIYRAGARLSPMTWWTGGRVRVVIPAAVLDMAAEEELRWILAHELGHIKRRDHLVRWIEWLAGVAFWWNPVVWLARRTLRLDEEDACDALVLERFVGHQRSYARTLLGVVETLADPRPYTPSLVTGIDAAESLERRLTKIVSPVPMRHAPRPLVVGVVAMAMALMTLGISGASERDTAEAAVAAAPEVTAAVPEVERYGYASATLTPTFSGTLGADRYTGSAADEMIIGRGGADRLSGAAGDDVIRGGAGRDTLKGGAGRDTLIGGADADLIEGGGGRDTIDAGAGNDVVRTWQDGLPDSVDCGIGSKDRAVVDSTDSTTRCEVIVVRDAS